jgi:hypothetical protein
MNAWNANVKLGQQNCAQQKKWKIWANVVFVTMVVI